MILDIYRRDYLYPWEWAALIWRFWLSILTFGRRGNRNPPPPPFCRLCVTSWPDDDEHVKCPGCGRTDNLRLAQVESRKALNDLLRAGATGPYREPAKKPRPKVDWSTRGAFPDLGAAALGNPILYAMFAAAALAVLKKQRKDAWWKALGLTERPSNRYKARKAYHAALLKAHPDQGGSREALDKVKKAWLRAERSYTPRETANG